MKASVSKNLKYYMTERKSSGRDCSNRNITDEVRSDYVGEYWLLVVNIQYYNRMIHQPVLKQSHVY